MLSQKYIEVIQQYAHFIAYVRRSLLFTSHMKMSRPSKINYLIERERVLTLFSYPCQFCRWESACELNYNSFYDVTTFPA